jgi:hypothetical protein
MTPENKCEIKGCQNEARLRTSLDCGEDSYLCNKHYREISSGRRSSWKRA